MWRREEVKNTDYVGVHYCITAVQIEIEEDMS